MALDLFGRCFQLVAQACDLAAESFRVGIKNHIERAVDRERFAALLRYIKRDLQGSFLQERNQRIAKPGMLPCKMVQLDNKAVARRLDASFREKLLKA